MDSIKAFAKEVAPLYKYNNWLGLGSEPIEVIEERVEFLARDLYNTIVHDFVGGDEEGFISSGRIIIFYWPFDEEPNEIILGLTIRTQLESDGEYFDVFDEVFSE